MKKVFAGLVSALAVAMLCVCLSACSEGITGTWKFAQTYTSYDGGEQTIVAGDEFNGDVITEDAFMLEINEDNTFTIKGSLAEKTGEAGSGTWEKVDGKYNLYLNDNTLEFTLKGNELIFEKIEEDSTLIITFTK